MNLEKHFDAATAVYKSTYSKVDAWHREKEEEHQKVKEEAQRLTEEAAKDALSAFVAKYDEQLKKITDSHEAEFEKIKQAYLQEVKAFYAPNGAAIDQNDKALLDSAILSNDEFSEMVVKHSENPTMLRLMAKYSQASEENTETNIRRALTVAKKAGESERIALYTYEQLMNAPIRMAQHGMAGSEAFMTAAVNADDYTLKAKADLIRAKLFLTADDDAKLQEITEKIAEARNAARAKDVDFLN